LNAKDLLHTFGLVGVWAIMFAETGLLVGFFFPGDSLLFLAGVAASPVADSIFGVGSRISFPGLLIGAPICAILGAQLGHWLGARYGRRMFEKPDSKLFKKEYVAKAEYYFENSRPGQGRGARPLHPDRPHVPQPGRGTLACRPASSSCGTRSARSSGPTAC